MKNAFARGLRMLYVFFIDLSLTNNLNNIVNTHKNQTNVSKNLFVNI